MKPSIAITLGAGVFAVMLGAYIVSYATTVRDPVEWKSGDVIVQDARAGEVLPLFAADGSGMTHIGIVEASPDGAVVIESAERVVATPMRIFLERGKDKGFAVYRAGSLNDEQRKAVAAAARRQLGKPNDFFLQKSWEALYSSELVRLAYSDIGVDVGQMQKLGKVAGDLNMVKSHFMRTWSANVDCEKRRFDKNQCWTMVTKQEVVTPASIANDARMTKIYASESRTSGFTLSRAAEPKPESPAP